MDGERVRVGTGLLRTQGSRVDGTTRRTLSSDRTVELTERACIEGVERAAEADWPR